MSDITSTTPMTALSGARMVAHSLIKPGRHQPRKRFDQAAMNEMAESVRKQGILQPLLLRLMDDDTLEIVAGERRWRAAGVVGLDAVPAIVRKLSLMEVLELQTIENVQREDLHPLEEAYSYDLLMHPPEAGPEPYSVEKVAERVNKSLSHIRRRLSLCRLLPQIKDAFMADTITLSTAQDLARRPVGMQEKAWPKILATRASDDKPVSTKDAERILQGSFMLRLANAPFPIKDASLLEAAGGCNVCPKRTGANPDLFDDVPDADTCTDPDCHAEKVQAFNTRRKNEARADGLPVIDGDEALALLKLGTASTALSGDYVYMDEPLEALTGNGKSLKKLLGTNLKPSALFEHPKDLTLREIVQVSKAQTALDDAGLLLNKPSKGAAPTGTSKATKRDTPNTDPSDTRVDAWPLPTNGTDAPKEGEEEPPRVQAERAWRKVAFEGVHTALHNKGFEPPLLLKRAVAVDLGSAYLNDPDLWDMVCRLWSWEPGKHYPAWANRKDQLQAVVDSLEHDMLDLLIAELVLVPDLNPTPAQIQNIEEAKLTLLAACADGDIGVDWESARKDAIKAMDPPKKKPRKPKTAASKKASTPAKAEQSQAPQGAQTMEDQSDLPHWVGQMVKVKGVKRIGEIRAIADNGDLHVAFTSGVNAGETESLRPHQVEILPGQTRPRAASGALPAIKSPARNFGHVPVKYRNPVTGETWTGRGLQPKWVQASIAAGKRLDDFAVEQ